MRRLTVGVLCVLAASACVDTGSTPSTLGDSTTVTSTTTMSSTTTTQVPSTESFSIPIGPDGVTYQLEGDPPSGPSSFVVLDDGWVVVADTMAAARGEPRLLVFDHMGRPMSVIDLAEHEVSAIVDVETDDEGLAILDVHADRDIYRVLHVDLDGRLIASTLIPEGSRFANGLTGLASDDTGVLLEFEFGHRYERLAPDGSATDQATLVINGRKVEIVSDQSKVATVSVGDAQWAVTRRTDRGRHLRVGILRDPPCAAVYAFRRFRCGSRVRRWGPSGRHRKATRAQCVGRCSPSVGATGQR